MLDCVNKSSSELFHESKEKKKKEKWFCSELISLFCLIV
jgi:hypothetical protein